MTCVICPVESHLSLSQRWLLLKSLKKWEQVLLPVTLVQLIILHRLDAFRCKLKAEFALTCIVQILQRSSLPVKIQIATHPNLLFWNTLTAASCLSHEAPVQSQLHKWQKEGCTIPRGDTRSLCCLYSDVHLLLLPYKALNNKFYYSALCKKPFLNCPTFQIASKEVFPSIVMTVWRLLPSPWGPYIDGHSMKYKKMEAS